MNRPFCCLVCAENICKEDTKSTISIKCVFMEEVPLALYLPILRKKLWALGLSNRRELDSGGAI